jgi:Helix-turn-helix domain
VERTLLSAAFDFVLDFDREIELKERTQRAAPWKSGASAPRQLPKLQPASAPEVANDVSQMLRGYFRQFSVKRLLRFLLALDQDVQIVVKPHHDRKNAPALQVF